jgi:galactosylceramidase
LLIVRGKVDKEALVGDAEQQALIQAQNDASEGGEKVLAAMQVPAAGPNRWHNVKLQFKGGKLTGFVDGKPVVSATDSVYGAGMAGVIAGADAKKLSMPFVDNVTVNQVNAPAPGPSGALPGQEPVYRPSK